MKKYFALTALSIALSGCGGSGGGGAGGGDAGGNQNAATNAAEGIWSGSFTDKEGNTTSLAFVVLETGEFWGAQVTEATQSGGVMHGKIQTGDGTFTSSMRMYFSNENTNPTPTPNGNFKSKSSFNFTGSEPLQTTYNDAYETQASLSSLAGIYNGFAMSKNRQGFDIDVNIDNKGNIIGGNVNLCGVTGQATPRKSGKNVFDVTLKAQGPECPSGTSSTAGIGILLGDELTLLTENPANNNVIGFSGNK
jgi:hypothetical protein